jgi:hypothetical protein
MLDCGLALAASIINLVVDFLEDEEKKTDLLGAWNMFKVERHGDLPPDNTLPTSASTDYARFQQPCNERPITRAHYAPRRQDGPGELSGTALVKEPCVVRPFHPSDCHFSNSNRSQVGARAHP